MNFRTISTPAEPKHADGKQNASESHRWQSPFGDINSFILGELSDVPWLLNREAIFALVAYL